MHGCTLTGTRRSLKSNSLHETMNQGRIQAHASAITHKNTPRNRYSRIRCPVLEGSGTCLVSRVLLKIPNTSEQTVFAHVSELIDAVFMHAKKNSDPSFAIFLQSSFYHGNTAWLISFIYFLNNLIWLDIFPRIRAEMARRTEMRDTKKVRPSFLTLYADRHETCN